MPQVGRDHIETALKKIELPDSSGDLLSSGRIENIVVNDGAVIIAIRADPAEVQKFETVRKAAEIAALSVQGVTRATAVLTAEATGAGATTPSRPSPPPRKEVPGIRNIIAVASGKGGVGKSTTAVNLALALSQRGYSVGLLDADIYGPSIPHLMGIHEKPEAEGKLMFPIEKHGVKTISIGYLIEEDAPMIWRGPIATRALSQLLRDCQWGELDYLIIDMPPGTGDIHLTMVQQVPLAGALIVSTPQDIALIDARKGLNMFRKVDVPILGIIENMSTFICPNCGERSDIFGHGGAREEAERLGVPFLGEIPLHLEIRTNSDAGKPVVVSQPQSEHSKHFLSIADGMIASLKQQTAYHADG